MPIDPKKFRDFRLAANLAQTALAKSAGVSQQLISQIERGENLTTRALPKIAKALGRTVAEINPDFDAEGEGPSPVTEVPILAWVSAGNLANEHAADDAIGTIRIADLPPGDWICLVVKGDSMNKVSPPESRIIVNRRDKRLVTNACYVIADANGDATYKSYKPDPMRFEPVSTGDFETIFPDNEPQIVGRVHFSILKL